jgi:hypothetical protein
MGISWRAIIITAVIVHMLVDARQKRMSDML